MTSIATNAKIRREYEMKYGHRMPVQCDCYDCKRARQWLWVRDILAAALLLVCAIGWIVGTIAR